MRGSCPEDGRGQMVALTEAGRAMLGRMERVHAGAVQEAVGARLSPEEAERLADLLGRLAAPRGDGPDRGTRRRATALSEVM